MQAPPDTVFSRLGPTVGTPVHHQVGVEQGEGVRSSVGKTAGGLAHEVVTQDGFSPRSGEPHRDDVAPHLLDQALAEDLMGDLIPRADGGLAAHLHAVVSWSLRRWRPLLVHEPTLADGGNERERGLNSRGEKVGSGSAGIVGRHTRRMPEGDGPANRQDRGAAMADQAPGPVTTGDPAASLLGIDTNC